LLGDRARYSTIMSNRLRAATIEQMTKLGYRYEVRGPQQRVNFYLQVADRVDVRSTHVTGFRPREIDGRYEAGTPRIVV
jgi:hypothetical protein